jgi:hypothetical protein
MIGRNVEWLLSVGSAALIAAGAFSVTAEPLAPMGMLTISFWVTAIILISSGVLLALVLIDLKRVFLGVPAIALLATLFYGAALMTPAVQMNHYANHLWNYALVQSVPVVIITLVTIAMGALAGTIINTSVREFDL